MLMKSSTISETTDYFVEIVKLHLPIMPSRYEFDSTRELCIVQDGRRWLLRLPISIDQILAHIIGFTMTTNIEGYNGASPTHLNLLPLNHRLVIHSDVTGINLIEICNPRPERISRQHLTGYRNGRKIKRSDPVAKAQRIKQNMADLTWTKDGIISSDSLDRYLDERTTEGIAITRF